MFIAMVDNRAWPSTVDDGHGVLRREVRRRRDGLWRRSIVMPFRPVLRAPLDATQFANAAVYRAALALGS